MIIWSELVFQWILYFKGEGSGAVCCEMSLSRDKTVVLQDMS